MSYKKITDKIYSVGVINPNLRVFDIVMTTEYGTSYNSYLVKGKEKNALIECGHNDYYTHFIHNVKSALAGEQIDYIILNHCEPDHTGSLINILKEYPDAQIIVSQAGSLYIKNITNRSDLNIKVVKNGETLNLGDTQLEFISAPFLHWPDSMFTWIEQEKTLFSCDFLGSHYCEPHVFDYNITFDEKYFSALKGYYDAIFGPFASYVRSGLNKIENLDIKFACTSHGPILTADGKLAHVIERYNEWCSSFRCSVKIIPVFYTSAYGNTAKIAHAIADGIKSVYPTAVVECYDIIEHDIAMLGTLVNVADAFALGSPTINRDAVAPVWNLLSHIDAINSVKKPVLLFGSYGWSGEALPNLKARLEGIKMDVCDEMLKVCFTPTQQDLINALESGKKFAGRIK